VTTSISFGHQLPGDDELRLCGELGDGMRAIELGIGEHENALAMAATGAKAIAVDPRPDAIGAVRSAAAERELTVQCQQADLADLGFATSASIDLVVADRTIHAGDDVDRLFRQVHRVIKSGRPFVVVVPHPFTHVYRSEADGVAATPYGRGHHTVGEWFIHLSRANFRVDQILELGVGDESPIPTTLILRAIAEGD
jgi:SAM-dependent methyltransferase